MRAELIALTGQAVAIRSQIMLQKTTLRQMLLELGQKDAQQRLNEQEFFLKYVHVSDEKIEELELRLKDVEKLRHAKIQEIMKIRKFRKALEKLRERAKVEYIKEQEKLEQKDMDDKTTIRFARKIIQNV